MLVTALNVAGDTGYGQVRERPGQSPLRDLRVKDHRNPPHDNRTDYRKDGNTGIPFPQRVQVVVFCQPYIADRTRNSRFMDGRHGVIKENQ